MAASGTSFQKKGRGKQVNIPGTRASLQNNQLLISSGIPSLDNCIGGGLAVGTVLLVEEDVFGSYSRLMLKYFLAEGIISNHQLIVTSADEQTENLINELPGPIIDDPGQVTQTGSTGNDQDMQIAWRYQNLPQMQSAPGGLKFGHYFDLTKTMSPEIIKNSHIVHHNPNPCLRKRSGTDGWQMNSKYKDLLQSIQQEIDKGGFSTVTPQQHKSILRIGIHSLASPQWEEYDGDCDHSKKSEPSLPQFLYALRSIMRFSYATCLITMPTHLFQDAVVSRRLEHLSDTVIKLDAFTGTMRESTAAFKEYHGIFQIIKLPRLNTLTCHMPDTLDLAFKLKRKKFTIERLHLPPELSDTAARDQEDPLQPAHSASSGCSASTTPSRLDF